MLTQSSEVFRTHPTMCRAVAVDCVKRLYDGLGIYGRGLDGNVGERGM